MPAFNINEPQGASTFSFGYSLGINQCNCPLLESEHQYQFVNNWTKIRGNHSFKFGADIRRAYNLRVPSDSHRAGELTFNNDTTAGDVGNSGSGLAAFLLGTTSSFIRFVSASTNASETQPRYFFYGQDTWRITPKLTVNYGLRWEIYKPESAAGAGQGGWIDLSTGEVRIAGQDGVNLRGNTATDYKHFAPRLGIAYQVTPSTVLRMGYGRSYDIGVFGTIFGHTITQTLPVLAQQSINFGTNAKPAFLLDQGPPSGDPAINLQHNCNPINDPNGDPVNDTGCTGPNGRLLYPGDKVGGGSRRFNNVLPSVDAWNVSLQRQFTPSLSATIAYVGNKATHTFTDDGPTYGANDPSVVGYVKGCDFAPGSATQGNALCGATGLPQAMRRPFYFNGPVGTGGSGNYGWTQGIGIFGNDANSNYNSLQVTADKRFTNGLQFQTSYTFQHSTNYDSSYYNIDPRVNHGAQPNYRNHVLIFTETYSLPFGKGKRWLGGVGRGADLIIGGWAISSATNFSSGLPFTPSLSDCSPSSDAGPCRPDVVGSVKDGTRSGDPKAGGYWFENTGGVGLGSAPGATAGPWGQPTLDSFGNVGHNTFRGPKLFNIDASMFKDFTLTEKVKAQLQFQFYNVLNHLNLDLPNTQVDSPNGGQITAKAYGTQMRALTFAARITF